MSEYKVNLAAFGLPDEMFLPGAVPSMFEVRRTGQVQNPATGKLYDENMVRLKDQTVYAEGYSRAFDRLFHLVGMDAEIRKYYETANYVELQIRMWIDDKDGIPSLHFEPEHLSFLNSLKAHVDVDIYALVKKTTD